MNVNDMIELTTNFPGILEMPYWKETFSTGYTDANGEPGISSGQESLIVSILSLGTFLGALTAAPTADFFGRKLGLILSTAIVFNLGVILQTIATSQPLFIAGRFFAGYGVGLISAMSKIPRKSTSFFHSAHCPTPQSRSINQKQHQNGFEAQSSEVTS
jgi:SP family sugar:H+ symporter-like MFS transporter